MKSTLAAELLNTENDVFEPERTTTSLLARVLPAEKLIEPEIGFATSDGKTTSSPGGESTVTTDAVLNITSTLAVYSYVTVIDNVTGDSIIEWN